MAAGACINLEEVRMPVSSGFFQFVHDLKHPDSIRSTRFDLLHEVDLTSYSCPIRKFETDEQGCAEKSDC